MSLLRRAENPRTAQTSAARSRLARALPNDSLADTSTTRSSVCSRSSSNSLTYGSPVRAETFQSIVRTSSPIWYGRTSANSIPRPLNAEWYSPPNTSSTSPRVRTSTWRIFLNSSRGITGGRGG